MDFIYHSYPTLGLLLSTAIVSSAVRSSTPRLNELPYLQQNPLGWLRTRPVQFWREVALPMYMLHQYEEYGYDIYGRRFAFQEYLCEGMLGFTDDSSQCPGTPRLLFLINFCIVWLFGYSARVSRKNARACLNFYAIMLANVVIHGIGFFRFGYNPGLLTALMLFLPSGLLAIHAMRKDNLVSMKELWIAAVTGVVSHVALLGGISKLGGSAGGDAVVVGLQLLIWTIAGSV